MRVSTDPTDPAYIDDRPRKVWLNDVEIIAWIVADEFRRCVIVPGVEYQMLEDAEPSRTPDRVLSGAVRIERLPVVVEAEPVVDHVGDATEMVEAIAPVGNFGDQSSPGDPSASNSAMPVHRKNKRRR